VDDFNAKALHESLSKENFIKTTLSTTTTEQNSKKSSSVIFTSTNLKCNNSTESKVCVPKTESLTTTLIAANISPTTSQTKTTTTTTTRTAWAVFKYCGTKSVTLRMKKI
jgi:hypothetical protein